MELQKLIGTQGISCASRKMHLKLTFAACLFVWLNCPFYIELSSAAFSQEPPAVVLRRGTQLIDSGRLQDALSVFQGFTRSRPSDGRGYFWMGVCYDEMGNYLAATQAYHDGLSKAEQSGMDSSEMRMNLGNVLLKQNQIDLAIEAFQRALEINPAYGLAALNLGRAYIAKGDYNSALASFEKCKELRFYVRQLPYYKAKALLGLGKNDEAASLIKRLLQDLPEGSAKQEIVQEFQSCLNSQK